MLKKFVRKKTEQSKSWRFRLGLVEREKRKIASELHDNISSKLAIIRLKLCNDQKGLSEVITLLDQTINSLRHLSHDLYKPSLKHINLLDAIRDHVLPLNDLIKIEIDCSSLPCDNLSHHIKLNLLRIIQEVIHNIIKHAQASCICIKLVCTDSLLQISIDDDGKGLPNSSIDSYGIGLDNIKYRARTINAQYKFSNKKTKGTKFFISLPIKNQPINGHQNLHRIDR